MQPLDQYEGLISSFAKIRIAVLILGEDPEYRWWKSNFFDTTSKQFLQPVFKHTANYAQVTGATEAAGRVHDASTGKGTYHLLRLPISVEASIHNHYAVHGDDHPKSTKDANDLLSRYSCKTDHSRGGAVNIGTTADIYKESTARTMSAAYLWGFKNNTPIYPFLTAT